MSYLSTRLQVGLVWPPKRPFFDCWCWGFAAGLWVLELRGYALRDGGFVDWMSKWEKA